MIGGAACGIIAGIALGIFSGAVGVLIGSVLGVGIGFVAGMILAEEDTTRSQRTRELDAIIGITKGSMGAASVPPRAMDEGEEEGEPLQTKEAWLAEWLTPAPPNVMG
jgi:ABC-type antimicrobial peptide transport system permease subunit